MGNSCKSKLKPGDNAANSKGKVQLSKKPFKPGDKGFGDQKSVTDFSSKKPFTTNSEHSQISNPSKPLVKPSSTTGSETSLAANTSPSPLVKPSLSVIHQGPPSRDASKVSSNSNKTPTSTSKMLDSSSSSTSINNSGSNTARRVPVKSVRPNLAQNSRSDPIIQVSSGKSNSVKQPNPSNRPKGTRPKGNTRFSPNSNAKKAFYQYDPSNQNANPFGDLLKPKTANKSKFNQRNKKQVSNPSQRNTTSSKLPTAQRSTTFTRLQDRQDGSQLPKRNVQAKTQSAPDPSSKKKLVVKGLKQFVNTRGSCPPSWVRDFPCKSKFHPDNYIYDWKEGPKAPCRPTEAMMNCPKQSARCGTCGIYTSDACNCCRKCPTDCGCPTLPNKFPDALNQAFGPGWTQAKQAIGEMTNRDRMAPVGGNAGKLLRNVYVSVNEQAPPHLRCHMDVLNPSKPEASCGSNNGSFENVQGNYQAPITHGYSSPAMPPSYPYYFYPPAPPMFPAYYPPPPMQMQQYIPQPQQQPPPYGYSYSPNGYPVAPSY